MGQGVREELEEVKIKSSSPSGLAQFGVVVVLMAIAPIAGVRSLFRSARDAEIASIASGAAVEIALHAIAVWGTVAIEEPPHAAALAYKNQQVDRRCLPLIRGTE